MELGTNRLKPPEKAERKTIRSPKAFFNSRYRHHFLVSAILDFRLLFPILLGFYFLLSRWTCNCDSSWDNLGAISYQIANEHPRFSQLHAFHIDIICDLSNEGRKRKTLPIATQRKLGFQCRQDLYDRNLCGRLCHSGSIFRKFLFDFRDTFVFLRGRIRLFHLQVTPTN